MSDSSTTEGNATPAPTQSNPVPPTNPAPQPQTDTVAKTLESFSTIIAALPEQIAKSVKEAVGTPQKPTTQPTTEPSKTTEPAKTPEPAKTTPEVPGKKRSFRDWWFSE